ncbi:NAD-dependent epimerase/dehydratase [Kribbella flavida DSM 17836]|uniref:NAD-dependent epimerase/dehydratase n=1 Tax=Kribbella flavida (strain DSM 17836 / JCM 10339 / NBRC 14399) TaxID=479435 RepID=D2PLW3_KRIFD|nr:NAD(P)-dependent oxidoreductase [Kribbella flavida]ADB32543.1 NAD-dependent epimerase/dehydratase [Kribbella flavida DSM 17836]
MSSSLSGARVLVTGAAGRIGSVATEHLAAQGALVTALTIVEEPSLKADRVVIGDTRSEDDVADALDGVDLVVHLAALPHRDSGTPYDVYTGNVVSTFNVLAQAGARGISRAVIASSINAYGVPMNPHDVAPAYFPLDEKIPSDVADWYSLSKQNDENTARMAWRHWGIDVVAFRFPHVNSAGALRRQAEGMRVNPAAGMREGWAYLDVRDAAYAIELGLTAPFKGQQTFFVAANTTNAPYATEELLDAFAPAVPRLRRFSGREVPIDLTAARTVLGFQAQHELDLPTHRLES